jgi:hypothetical protein
VQTSLPGSTYSGSGGPDPVNKRDMGLPLHRRTSKSQKQLLLYDKKSYPQGTRCQKWTWPKKCHRTITTTTKTIIASSTSLTTVRFTAVSGRFSMAGSLLS